MRESVSALGIVQKRVVTALVPGLGLGLGAPVLSTLNGDGGDIGSVEGVELVAAADGAL
jgi:hypothetical protein